MVILTLNLRAFGRRESLRVYVESGSGSIYVWSDAAQRFTRQHALSGQERALIRQLDYEVHHAISSTR